MEINGWYSGCLVRAFPWIDGKYIYVNVRCFFAWSINQPGTRLGQDSFCPG